MPCVRDALFSAVGLLENARIEDARANAEMLLSNVLKAGRGLLYAEGQRILSSREEKLFNKYLNAKISGLPFEYITKQAEFCGRLFYVDRRVLIPRGETQDLVELALEEFSKQKSPLRVLDLCCGSSCIGVTWALAREQDEVLCSDKSAAALKVTRKNVAALAPRAKIKTLQSDLFSNLKGRFDLIISNPPYVSKEDMAALAQEVNFEPKAALRGGANGTKIIKKIVQTAPDFLESGGLLAFEFGRNQAAKIVEFFNSPLWRNVRVKKDFNNIERFIFAVKK